MKSSPAPPAPLGRGRKFVMGLLMAALMTLFCLVALEGLFRIAGIEAAPLPYDNNLADAVLGMRPEPSRRWKANFPEYPGELYMQTNNLALYEEFDTPSTPLPDVIRVGVVGDSQTVGTCRPDENYPNQLEALLNEKARRTAYEVLNAGVGRYSPYQDYLRAKREFVPIGTRQLIVAVYVGNDFLDLIREDDRPSLEINPQGEFEPRPPTFMYYRDPDAAPSLWESSRVVQVGRGLLGPTILYQISRVRLLHRNLSQLGRGLPEIGAYINQVRLLDKAAHGLMLQSLHQQVWFDRFPETLETAFAVNRHVAELFAELGKTNGIEITYVAIPTKPSIEPERLAETFQAVAAVDPRFTVESVRAFEDMLIDRTIADAREQGMDAVDLRPALRKAAASTELYYPQDMHLNVAGNRAVAHALADYMATK